MRCDGRYISPSCFCAPLFLSVIGTYQRSLVLITSKPKHVATIPLCAAANASIVILGGSSGVGKEAAKYLESKSASVKIVSRRTGYDFLNPTDVVKALAGSRRAAISVGAGRRGSSSKDEVDLYKSIANALSSTSQLELAVVVLRNLILPEVQRLFQQSVKVPWVLLRPGPLMDKEERLETSSSGKERILVTSDIRCNGLVSRAAVGRVVGDLLLGQVPVQEVKFQTFGVYDLDRMINYPQGIQVLGKHLWH